MASIGSGDRETFTYAHTLVVSHEPEEPGEPTGAVEMQDRPLVDF